MALSLTPEGLKQWLAAITVALGLMGSSVGGVYTFAVKNGIWGGRLEKANKILADEHVGEEPVQKVVITDLEDDYQVVKIYKDGDTLYHRKYVDAAGELQRVSRWTSKRSLESILGVAWQLDNVAYAGHRGANKVLKEIYIGQTAEGHSVYRLLWAGSNGIAFESDCAVVDEGTGSYVSRDLPEPCEQYVAAKQD